ncbi:MAG: signal peptidase I [Alphaproteobacteria bacterium 41-28]|nr:MAG: signal peptidase I [Alphaproteobacteria bacterium 41-28]
MNEDTVITTSGKSPKSLLNAVGKSFFTFILPVTLVLVVIGFQTQLHECASPSLHGIRYILFKKRPPLRRGDIVSIQEYDTKYVQGKILTKRVIGLPGDIIVRDKEGIRILTFQTSPKHSQPKTLYTTPLPLLKKTTDGKPLTPISATIIPSGHIFVAGDNLYSFDSRYEEFGLVPMEKIWGKAVLTM